MNTAEGCAVREARGLVGTCEAPGSPDVTLMALALAARAEGVSTIRRSSRRPEVRPLMRALEKLGIGLAWADGVLTVTGGAMTAVDEVLDAGDSALGFGCLAGLLAGAGVRAQVTGQADVGRVRAALRALGADGDDACPASVGGEVRAASFDAGAPDAAMKAAFFLAGLTVSGEVRLLQSAAGDDDLEVLLKAAGVTFEKVKEVGKEGYHLFLTGPQTVQPALHDLPGDPDATLYLLGAAAMLSRSELVLHGVGNDWKTRRALELLRRFNAQMDIQVARSESKFSLRTVKVQKSELRRTRIAGDQTALFLQEVPFLAVLGTQASGETVIRDAQSLREGPVDRLSLIAENLRRMEARVGEMPDGLVVQGPVKLQGAELDAGGDVRVGVALAMAGLAAEGETQVLNAGSMADDFSELFAVFPSVIQEKR